MQMIIVTYQNGQKRLVQAQSWRQLDSESATLGAILLTKSDSGGKLYAIKSAIQEVEEIPQATWDANIEAQKKAQEAKAATLALLESKTLRGRLRKLLGRKA
jgi:hypothetical protein